MTCRHGCKFGFQGTDEVILPDGAELEEVDVWLHLERCAILGDRTKIKACKCQEQEPA